MTARARRQPLAVPAVSEVSDEQLRDEFWDLALKTFQKLAWKMSQLPAAPPVDEWSSPHLQVVDLPLELTCWNEAVKRQRRLLLTAGPPRLTDGAMPDPDNYSVTP